MQIRLPAVAALVLMLLAGACGSRDDKGALSAFDPRGYDDPKEARETHKQIEQLRGIRLDADPEKEAEYHIAKEKLINKGNRIQGQLLEALKGHADWGVRLGVLHVLDAVGDKRAVEPLIAAILDDHPLVAQKAMYSLRSWTGHREIVPAGSAAEADPHKLPPVPLPEVEKGEDDVLVWTAYHDRYARQLHDRWLAWWTENRRSVDVR